MSIYYSLLLVTVQCTKSNIFVAYGVDSPIMLISYNKY